MSTAPVDPLLAWRDEFPILADTNYLISNSLGAMPAAAADALNEYAKEWAQRGVRTWEEGWWDLAVETGNRIAPLLDVPLETVCMHQNVTVASGVVRSCFDWSARRNRIVFTELNFPSVIYLYEGARSLGAEIVTVPANTDGISVDTERLLAEIDDRTALVPISHVLFRSAFIQDARAICERAQQVGARVCLDVYHSAGVYPLEIEAWGADFAVGGCLKWLCGGPGNAFLYVRQDLHASLEPQLTGWMASEAPFRFDPQLDRSRSIYRFLTGTPNVPAHRAALPGIEIVNEVGPTQIRAKSVRQTTRIIERAKSVGVPVASPTEESRRGGTVTLSPPGAAEICGRLIQENILVDYRPGAGIRLAPHFYTADSECDVAVDRIAELQR